MSSQANYFTTSEVAKLANRHPNSETAAVLTVLP
jgi:hypothetical protein